MFQKPSATNVPVVAPLWAVLMQGVLGSSDDGVDVFVEPQKPFPHPPLFGVVLQGAQCCLWKDCRLKPQTRWQWCYHQSR